MKFNLKDFEHLRNDYGVQFKDEIVDGVGVTSICYMISNDKLWGMPLGRECRGHSFNTETGELISMAFNKFFNLEEKAETQIHNLDWTQDFEVASKADGSMISFALINDEVYAKTKKSFHSDVAILANALLPQHIYEFVKHNLSINLSPIFEFTHPEWKIVVDYGEATWTLLAIRDMNTGEYFDKGKLDFVANNSNIKLIEYHEFKSHDEIQQSINTMTEAEGYVIHFPNTGLRVKTKCSWYNLRHKLNTDLRERDVAKMIVEETLDDIKSCAIDAGFDILKIEEIENKVISDFIIMAKGVDTMKSNIIECPSRKEAAIKYSKEKYFSEGIRSVDGRDVDYKKMWYNEYMQNYTLRTIYSNFNKVV